ncbi:MAG: tetratricopeptide repeat protein [Kofleriaceae bacterium]|nr:tetratricopeptide repeat protein [Kofleriaceae bacterium]
MMLRSHRLALAVAGLLLAAVPAAAETPPWSVGVSEAQKKEAQKSLDAGNAKFLDQKYAEALENYKVAVAAWDHPAIRFNMVRCLILLDRPVEASDNLKQALKYGAAPLEDTVYAEALSYDKLLASQIADLSVTCKQAGVKITLDGQPFATCPAAESRRVAPGSHQVVGTKQGYLTRTVEVVIVGGKRDQVTLDLDPIEKAARVVHRWPGWVPWVVFGSGFAIASIGGVLNLSAAADMESYDRTVTQQCSVLACSADDPRLGDFAKLDDSARTKSQLAIGIMTAGGATVVTGAVMLYLNRGRTVYPESIERLRPSVTPMPGGAALSLGGTF